MAKGYHAARDIGNRDDRATSVLIFINWNGARDRTRTGTALRPRDFKSPMSTIPPRGHGAIPMRTSPGGQE